MSSRLNSISSGDLWVCNTPGENPVKEDSILDLLQNSEIEFATCSKREDKLNSFNTGFGENNELHFDDKCKKPSLKTPLYRENYLTEFVTSEEKAAARKALGLYNGDDVVSMSLLAAKLGKPTNTQLANPNPHQMRKGDEFFSPYTMFKTVLDSSGKDLAEHKQELKKIIDKTSGSTITSLGDVRLFLKGFKNGDNLHNTVDRLDKEMLRFETVSKI